MNAPFPSTPGTSGNDPRLPLKLLIAAPRGFCAGVDRAIEIVERALQKYGAPVYVRHEIVHNRYVVDSLKAKGAIFVEELDEVPDDAPVVFSAHGVPKAIPAEAERRKMLYVDATCPLVSKVHRQAERQIEKGQHILFIGHAGHPEVIGTMGGSRWSRRSTTSLSSTSVPMTIFPTSRRPRSRSTIRATSSRRSKRVSRRSLRPRRKTSAMPPATGRRRSSRSRRAATWCW